jgi:cytochrome P450
VDITRLAGRCCKQEWLTALEEGEIVATTESLPRLPFDRSDVLGLPPFYGKLLRDQPISLVRTPAGDVGWLVTRYADVKALLGDERLGKAHPAPERAARYSASVLQGGPIGDPATEPEQYALMRRLLTPSFTPRRMRAIRPVVEGVVDDLLGRLAEQAPPAGFQAQVSFPLAITVICRLLGVPGGDREQIRGWADATTALYDGESAAAGFMSLVGYVDELIKIKRARPGEDVLSDLLAAGQANDAVTDGYIATLVAGILFAGHDTTVLRLDYGVLYLLSHPDLAGALRRDPSRAASVTEEVLRLAAPARPPALRWARTDIDAGAVTIRTGDLVMLATQAANTDERLFPEPARFDTGREPNPHVTFGHGHHFCLGASLARIEMQELFGRLFLNLPGLRLAVPIERLRIREDNGGLEELPVAW